MMAKEIEDLERRVVELIKDSQNNMVKMMATMKKQAEPRKYRVVYDDDGRVIGLE